MSLRFHCFVIRLLFCRKIVNKLPGKFDEQQLFPFSGKPNFGTIEVDWEANPPTLKLETRDSNGIPVTGLGISLLELHSHRNSKSNLTRNCILEVDLSWFLRRRLNILIFSILAGI